MSIFLCCGVGCVLFWIGIGCYRGKFATVRRAMHKKTGVNFAAKFLRRRRRAQCTLKEIRHEIAILLLCAESQHIVKLFSVHETNVETALFLEMANGGELQTLLDENGSLSERETIICMKEVLKALQFLHKKSIAHLDLKPQNILLCGKRVEGLLTDSFSSDNLFFIIIFIVVINHVKMLFLVFCLCSYLC